MSPHGSDRARGIARAPVRTLGHALALAAAWAERGESVNIRPCSSLGGYAESLTLGPQHAGISIVGGYSCFDFSPSDEPTEIIAPRARGHHIEGATGVLLGDLVLGAIGGTKPEEPSVALSVVRTEGVRVTRSEIRAGRGADGRSIEASFEPAPGGTDGADSDWVCAAPDSETEAATTLCGDVLSTGGLGGLSGVPGAPTPEAGQDGVPGASGGLAAATGTACEAGGDGMPGADGSPGAGAPRVGVLTDSGYQPSVGGSGGPGAIGGAGGGAGGKATDGVCVHALRSASGGSGGCGGSGGAGGWSGGGSFAVVAIDSYLVLDEVTLLVQSGGRGGHGGVGQAGGAGSEGGRAQDPGGTGCQGVDGTSVSTVGGDGGAGGSGGPGGGGAGGPSVGVAFRGAAPSLNEVMVSLPELPAPAGLGGGGSEANAGPAGLLAKEWEF